jgi:uncharacterized protein
LKNVARLILILSVGCFIGLSLMSWIVAGQLTAPRPSAVVFPPDLQPENVQITSADGVSVPASWLAGRASKPCALVGHGNGGNRAQLLDIIRIFRKNGISVLTLDFRGHGESDAPLTTAGYLEARDADLAFAHLKSRCGKRKIITYGFSMGGAAMLLGKVGKKADMLMLEAVYSDIETAIRIRINQSLGKVGETVVTPFLIQALAWRTGIEPANMSPAFSASQVTAPTLLLAGQSDVLAPVSDSEAIRANLRGPSQLIVVPEAVHGDIAYRMGGALEKTVMDFVRQHL